MTRETLILRPFNMTSSRRTAFSFSYLDKRTRKQFSLLSDGGFYEGPLVARDQRALDEKKIFFDKDNFEYKLEFDAEMLDAILDGSLDRKLMYNLAPDVREAIAILRHPDVYHTTGAQSYNHNPIGKKWIVELRRERLNSDFKTSLIKMQAINRFFSEDPMVWRELAFYFGVNPIGKDPDELANIMASPDKGAIVVTRETAEEFMEFVQSFDARIPRVVCQKALALGVIHKDREQYMYLDTPLGKTVAEVIEVLSKDKTVNMMVIKATEDYDSDIVRYQEGCDRVARVIKDTLSGKDKKKQPSVKGRAEIVTPITSPKTSPPNTVAEPA
jgi:hypothetical protein